MEYNGDAISDSEWYEAEELDLLNEKLDPSEVQCPRCHKIDEIDNCQTNYRKGHSKGEWWWEATYQCGECGHRWREGDCSL